MFKARDGLRWAALLSATIVASGCVGSIESLFNTEFLDASGLAQTAADIPGPAPALLVNVENRTNRNVLGIVSYRLGDSDVREFLIELEPGLTRGQALTCPVSEVTLGDVSALDEAGAFVFLGGGTVADAFVEVEPFGVLLREGSNYSCGDSITFAIMPASTRTGYTTIAFIQRAEEP